MKEPAIVSVEIGPTGDFQISVQGVKGQSCVSLTRALEEQLGEVTNTDLTEEAHESVNHNNIQRLGLS